MKRFLALLILCVALALVRVVLMVLAITLLLVLVHSFATRPRETLAFMGTLTLSWLAVAQPFACIAGAVVVAVVVLLARRRRKLSGPIQLEERH